MLYYCERLNSIFQMLRSYKLLEENKKDKKLLTVASEHSKNKAHGLRKRKKIRSPITATVDWDNTEISKNKQQLKE